MPGIMLDSDGTLHGTPPMAGIFEIYVRVTDGSKPYRQAITVKLYGLCQPDGHVGHDGRPSQLFWVVPTVKRFQPAADHMRTMELHLVPS